MKSQLNLSQKEKNQKHLNDHSKESTENIFHTQSPLLI